MTVVSKEGLSHPREQCSETVGCVYLKGIKEWHKQKAFQTNFSKKGSGLARTGFRHKLEGNLDFSRGPAGGC